MKILGIAFAAHNSSAALLEDGDLTFFIEEERLNRLKNSGGFPLLSIKKCLEARDLQWKDIDAVAYFRKPWLEAVGNAAHFLKYFPRTLHLLNYSPDKNEEKFLRRLITGDGVKKIIKEEFGSLPKLYFIEHHMAHAASAFYGSGFDHAAILTLDGRGEHITSLIAEGSKTNIKKLKQVKVPHSLGHLYAAVTNHLGFNSFNDEWKVMGMAAYGDGSEINKFSNLISLDENKLFELDLSYFSFHTEGQSQWLSPKFYQTFGDARKSDEPLLQHHFNIAQGLQVALEKTAIHIAKVAHKLTGSENICLAGGVALNCLMNTAILRETPFKKIFVQPLANDAGTSYGSALYLHHAILKNNERHLFRSAYLGSQFSEKEIEDCLIKNGLSYQKENDIEKQIAKALAENKIVGLFQGRMEAGPRALGNRSILANPCNPEIRNILNLKIKKRENFRPLAPVVISEKSREFFESSKNSDSPYMVLTANVREEKKQTIPAVTHADGSARWQTVNKTMNPLLYKILLEFEEISGIPVLLNTSFNENEPIVCQPQEAIDCFLRTKMDLLCIGNFLLRRKEN